MKIVLACAQFPPVLSGYSKVADNLRLEFERAGHSVAILTEGKGCTRVGRVYRLTKEGVRLLKSGPDIVQVIGPSPLFTEQVVDVGRSLGLPVVYKIDAFAGLSTYYSGVFARLTDTVYVRTALARALRSVDWIVFSTRDFAESLETSARNWSVIPLGVQDECVGKIPRAEGRTRAPGDNLLRILFVGQLRRYKGVRFLLQAARELLDHGMQIQVTIVGGGPSRAELENLVDRLELGSVVTFRGPIADAPLHSEYLTNDVLVLPSLLGESFGIVLAEARLHGMQVVASDLPGVREVVRNLGGRVVPPGEPHALAEVLMNMQFSPARGLSEISSFLAECSWPSVARAYIRVYEQIMKSRHANRVELGLTPS